MSSENDVSASEACHRFRTLCSALLDQLLGLKQTKIRFCVSPPEALDAVKFWLLPKLEGELQPLGNETFLLRPEKAAEDLLIDFVEAILPTQDSNILDQQNTAFEQGFEIVSTMGTSCPDCGSRWF